MNKFDEITISARIVLIRCCEILALLVGLFVLVYLLLGEASGTYVVGVVTNVSLFVSAITPQSLIGIALVTGIYLIWKNRRWYKTLDISVWDTSDDKQSNVNWQKNGNDLEYSIITTLICNAKDPVHKLHKIG